MTAEGDLGPFDRVGDRLADASLEDPGTYWRTGFTLAAVDAGYAFERTADVTSVLAELREGDVAVVGAPGVGKSTACKQVACRWREDDGPVYYAEAPDADADLSRLVDRIHDAEGHALVVLETAVGDDGTLASALLDRSSAREDVSVLLEVHRPAVDEPGGDEATVARELLAATSTHELPALDREAFEAAVEHFETVTGDAVVQPAGTIFDDIRQRGVEGNELLHLAHRVSADGESSFHRAVQHEYERCAAAPDPVGDIALLVNLLNAADLPLYSELLFAVDAPNEAVDEAIDRLLDDVLFRQVGRPAFASYHRLWSALYLEQFLERAEDPHERFAEAVGAILRAMDPDERDRLWSWVLEHATHGPADESPADDGDGDDILTSDARTKTTAVGTTARVVEQLFAVGTRWPDLAPLFGTSERDALPLAEHCSTVTRTRAVSTHGRMYFDRGDFEAALQEFEHAQQLLEAATDVSPRLADRFRIDYFVDRGRVAVRRGKFDRADSCYRAAHEMATDLGDRRGRARAHMHLGVTAVKSGDLSAAVAHLTAGERLFRDCDDAFGVAKSLGRLGVARLHRGELDAATDALERAIEQFQRLGDRMNVARYRNNLGIVAMSRGDYETAAAHYRQSLRMNRESGNRAGVAKNNLNLGNLSMKRDDDEAARRHFQEALSVARSLGDRDTESTARNNLGVLAADRGDLDAAVSYFRQSLDICRTTGNRRGEARALNNLGDVARERGDLDEAESYHRESLEIRRETGEAEGRANCHRMLGRCALAREDLDAAEDQLRTALDRYAELGDDVERAQTLRLLARVARERGDVDAALDRLVESVELFGRTASDRREETVEELEALAAEHDREVPVGPLADAGESPS
ncbi:hypothetical protein BRC81_01910 [Halobacteriales archaeon QS_1_68_20]|nr:MAG: hypothetical protein BRC81_01910 [Halobacteriales archaeon QS_1_68_20]